ncbi:glycosyltransferase family 2 protein [Edwardsiella tarda]|uniref:glycosyltransferase family 2 protein n=1 Tax=Edwardsiella tarda TaxID=636 RepID=UPI003B505110
MEKIKFSLILCTLGREREVFEFVESLKKNKCKSYELIIVDQNKNSRLSEISNILNDVRVVYKKVDFCGLSKARNFGLSFCIGNIIAFPDDDCIYQNYLLDRMINVINKFDYDFYSINTKDMQSGRSLISHNLSCSEEISILNRRFVSFTLFFKKHLIDDVGGFDERMGVGADSPFGAGEESDYVVRALKKGYHGLFLDYLYAYHLVKSNMNTPLYKRQYLYGGGYAYFLYKHQDCFGKRYLLLRSLGVLLSIIKRPYPLTKLRNSLCFSLGYYNVFIKAILGIYGISKNDIR